MKRQITPVEKTKIIAVLTLILGVIEDVGPCKKSKKLDRQLKKVEKFALKCFDSMVGKKFSQGAKRELTRLSHELFRERVPLVGDKVSPESVTQELIACDGLLHSIRLFLKPKGGSCWWNLAQTLERLTKDFIEMFPEHEDWELYAKFDEVLKIRVTHV